MILNDRSIAVDIHIHDTTKQDHSLNYIVYGNGLNESWPIIRDQLIYGFPAKGTTFPHDLLERG